MTHGCLGARESNEREGHVFSDVRKTEEDRKKEGQRQHTNFSLLTRNLLSLREPIQSRPFYIHSVLRMRDKMGVSNSAGRSKSTKVTEFLTHLRLQLHLNLAFPHFHHTLLYTRHMRNRIAFTLFPFTVFCFSSQIPCFKLQASKNNPFLAPSYTNMGISWTCELLIQALGPKSLSAVFPHVTYTKNRPYPNSSSRS